MPNHMLRISGLLLIAALGLMMFAAEGVLAEELKGTPGEIRIAGAPAKSGQPVRGEQVGGGTLLIPALNTEIVCQKANILSGSTLSSSSVLSEILYQECVYWGTKKVLHEGVELLVLTAKLPCEILEEGTTASGSIFAKVKLLVVLHESLSKVKDTYVLVEPDELSSIAGVLTTTPSECPLPKLVTISGSTVFQVTLGDLILNQPEELYVLLKSDKTIAKLFSDKLLFGTNEAHVDGSALLWLFFDDDWGLI